MNGIYLPIFGFFIILFIVKCFIRHIIILIITNYHIIFFFII